MRIKVLLVAVVCWAWSCAAQSLQVYAIDVEGGKSTLYVSPSGESMLIDTGYDGFGGRDAQRIAAAAKAAGVRQIDYLVISHYHVDHAGGVRQLAALMPIRNFVDHGKTFETGQGTAVYDAYVAERARGNHIEVKAGDRVPIRGLDVLVVTASGKAIAGGGTPNPLCAGYRPLNPDLGENAHSIGLVIALGKFRLADLGDLHWNREYDLACPNNLLGTVDVFMTTHHAKQTSIAPALVQALRFKAAIMNNGPDLGADPPAWETIHNSPGQPDIWQLHAALKNDAAHNAPEKLIANPPADCQAQWVRL